MDEGEHISSIRSLRLDLPPSCVEFCPAHPDFFVVGTYNLQKDEVTDPNRDLVQDPAEQRPSASHPQNRNGSLVVFHLEGDEVHQMQTLLQPSALLDLHFHPHPDKQDIFAVVSSTGTLSFFQLTQSSGYSAVLLKELATRRPLGPDDSVLLLSCCWHPTVPDLIAVTTSTHEVHVLRVDGDWNVLKTHQNAVLSHDLEAWTVSFSPNISSCPTQAEEITVAGDRLFTIYSGGDDSQLRQTACQYHHAEVEPNDPLIQTPYPAVKLRGHGAGVTAILPLSVTLPDGAVIVLTGSYDDHIRVYAVYEQGPHSIGLKSRLLEEVDLGGGVWRLKLVSLVNNEIEGSWTAVVLASCMHAGTRILAIAGQRNEQCTVQVLARFEEHKSMNYASDFQPGSGLSGRILRCVSTSFYDKLMCLWEVRL